MKIFISWSGDFSREVAEKLSVWIPSVIQSVDVFFSPDDIGKGENWNNVLSRELNDCNFGIVCLTPENVTAPWIHFEAGALAKALNARVSSIMLGINTSEVKGPLSRFQNTKFERADFFKLVQAINNVTDKPLGPNALEKIFGIMWTELEKEIQPIMQKYSNISKPQNAKTSEGEAIQEILSIVRKMSSSTFPSEEKGLTVENYERTITPIEFYSESVPDSKMNTYFTLKKCVPGQVLLDSTKTMLNKVLSPSRAHQAIQCLEENDTFSWNMPISKEGAFVIRDMLRESPDIVIELEHRIRKLSF